MGLTLLPDAAARKADDVDRARQRLLAAFNAWATCVPTEIVAVELDATIRALRQIADLHHG